MKSVGRSLGWWVEGRLTLIGSTSVIVYEEGWRCSDFCWWRVYREDGIIGRYWLTIDGPSHNGIDGPFSRSAVDDRTRQLYDITRLQHCSRLSKVWWRYRITSYQLRSRAGSNYFRILTEFKKETAIEKTRVECLLNYEIKHRVWWSNESSHASPMSIRILSKISRIVSLNNLNNLN